MKLDATCLSELKNSANSDTSGANAATTLKPSTWQHEPVLRSAIITVLQETSGDEDAFAFLRDVCRETLAYSHRAAVADVCAVNPDLPSVSDDALGDERGDGVRKTTVISSATSECEGESVVGAGKTPLMPPRSPQERLLALVPNAIEKGKRSYQRRPSPEYVTWTSLAIRFTGVC